ncbi:MAG TPA: family 43 glycosylhydrolase [Bacteroidales bacterium]
MLSFTAINAQNPIVRDQFTADPSARVFGDKVYVYPSHDILAKDGQGRPGWFCMADYHVFSTSNLTDWTDHGVIVSQNKVKWVDSAAYAMWAPDCIERNGKYYFYFPAIKKDTFDGRGFGIGVAVSDSPYGPFVPEEKPIKKVHGIDPNVFIDKDGQAYLYWSMRNIYVAKLKDNMLEIEGEPQVIANLPENGLKEGPWLFERNGIYYMTFPHVENKTERLEYAMGKSPMGPFSMTGVVMDESESGCWTNHHSFINFKGQWYLFYHNNDLSPKFDKNRSIRVDSLFFNEDGTIRKVIPTFRGVGLTSASSEIQIDRYSAISKSGVSVTLLDTANTFKGWKTVFENKDSWIQYNSVDFGKEKPKIIVIKALSEKGGDLLVKTSNAGEKIIAKVKIPANKDWIEIKLPVSLSVKGVHNIVVSQVGDNPVEVDWISFK